MAYCRMVVHGEQIGNYFRFYYYVIVTTFNTMSPVVIVTLPFSSNDFVLPCCFQMALLLVSEVNLSIAVNMRKND